MSDIKHYIIINCIAFIGMFFLLLPFSLFQACNDEAIYTPKPRAFPKIELPEKAYQPFDKDYCKFTFEYPEYAKVVQDTLFFDERPKNPCWFDLQVLDLNAFIHFSYIPISEKDKFDKLVSDAFRLTNKHNIKADYIEQIPIRKPNGIGGYVFDVDGPVASPFQFFLTDSTDHFLRGALYVKDKARPDSLAPIYAYLKTDMMHLINTFEWEE